jgi:hypothetical protein
VERIADPVGLAFTAVARLQVVGRGDAHRGRRLLIPCPPAERFEPGHRTAVVLLDPVCRSASRAGRALRPREGSAVCTDARS